MEQFKILSTSSQRNVETKGKLSTDNFLFLTKEKVEEYKKMLK